MKDSHSRPCSKKVIDIKTKEIFDCILKAAASIGTDPSGLCKKLAGKVYNNTDFVLLKDYEEDKEQPILSKPKPRKTQVINIITKKVYDSIIEASKAIDMSRHNLTNRLKGKVFKDTEFLLMEDYINNREVVYSKIPKNKKVINIETKEVFNSIKETAKFINKSHNYLCSRLNEYTPNNTPFQYYDPEIHD